MGRIRKAFDRFYWKLANRVTPGLVNAQRRYLRRLLELSNPNQRWLDLGCGSRIVPQWIPEAQTIQAQLDVRAGRLIGIDCDHASLARNHATPRCIQGQVGQLPFQDNSFDLVTANMVVEHLEQPELVLQEIHRVLKPSGVFLFQTPNLLNPMVLVSLLLPQRIKNLIIWFLQGRAEHDVFPTYYRMNRSSVIQRLAQQAGLGVGTISLVETSAETVMLGPLVIFELLFIRLTRCHALRSLRSDIIATLKKPAPVATPQLRPAAPATHSQAGVTPHIPEAHGRPTLADAA